jgi:hypothetical protein
VIWTELWQTSIIGESTWKKKQGRDWKKFFLEMTFDTANGWCKMLLEQMSLRFDIIICTGRPEQFRRETEDWLNVNQIPYKKLLMRPNEDNRPDDELKSELYEKYLEPLYEIILVVEDRQSAVDMWRKKGLTCLQCSKS